MKLSVIINTCALEDNDTKSSGGKGPTHAGRAYALRNFILPRYIADPLVDEIIVVGTWGFSEEYTYIPMPSVYKSCTDALLQRHAAAQAATGDILIFQHDDHMFSSLDTMQDIFLHVDTDVLSPARYTRLRSVSGERLNNGEQHGYISGHGTAYRREVIEQCPWGDVPPVFTWDIEHTKQIRAAGFNPVWSEDLQLWDCEFESEPWK